MDFHCYSNAESVALLAARISHILRTPLGTATAVIDDLSNGHALEARDISDARYALARIKDALDAIKVCVVDLAVAAAVDLRPLVEDAVDLLKMSGAPLRHIETSNVAILERGSPALLRRALYLLPTYLFELGNSSAGAGEVTVSLEVDETYCRVVFCAPNKTLGALTAEPMRCQEVASGDHSIQAISLLFAEHAAMFHGGGGMMWQESNGVHVTLYLRHSASSWPRTSLP